MLIYKVLLGFAGLGVVVFVHELGHFIAARLMGITVEAFSIGWGKPIFKKKIGDVEYRIGLFPLGGYCKMKGENEFEESYNNGAGVHAEKGSYFAAHPLKRAVTCVAGPLFNLVFAVLVFTLIWGIGFEVNTLENRIILASEIISGSPSPAQDAGFKTGDRIVSIEGKKTETFMDIQEIITVSAGKELLVEAERNGEIVRLSITPEMDKSTGAGKIGVYSWTEPLIESVAEGSAAEIAGLKPGDRITGVNGNDMPHTMALYAILEEKPQVLDTEFTRDGQSHSAALIPVYNEQGAVNLGIAWKIITYRTPRLSPPLAIAKGAAETWKTLSLSVTSFSLLFRGVDLTQAVSGPVRITYMLGDVAAEGFNQSFGAGISSMGSFLALISVALCVMNLLPLPILDGGMILLFLIECVRRKPVNPKFVSIFQTVGVVLIAGLMIFAVFGDILYLANR